MIAIRPQGWGVEQLDNGIDYTFASGLRDEVTVAALISRNGFRMLCTHFLALALSFFDWTI